VTKRWFILRVARATREAAPRPRDRVALANGVLRTTAERVSEIRAVVRERGQRLAVARYRPGRSGEYLSSVDMGYQAATGAPCA
jgi:hypothetical protein